MALTAEDVIRIANLARLSLSPAETLELTDKLSRIVGLVEQLADVNTDGVEPMVHAFDLNNVLADDFVGPSLARDLALRNSPSSDSECFRVPAVLG
jgi:aspartyl-tRNA(Asn)/glutamyl-tRNA(Gln) amidotransferase subunit C